MTIEFFESELMMPTGMVRLPLRSTAIQTAGGVVLISPIALNEKQVRDLKALGTVTEIVAPSLLHHIHIQKTAALFPNATIWGPPDAREKLPDISWNKIFGVDPWTHETELPALRLAGVPRLSEIVFLHQKTKTLVVTDLFFHLLKPKGWAAPIVLRMMGTYKKFAVSKFIQRFLQDPAALRKSLDQVMQWDFDRLVVAHGDIVDTGAKAKAVGALKSAGYL